MKHLILFCCLMMISATAASQNARSTWRLDYFFTGGPGIRAFSLDRVVVEPLPWAGHPTGSVETGLTGAYRFEVLDSTGTAIYARGFSSIFGEWLSTGEAGEKNRTFHESLRFPAPDHPVTVLIHERHKDKSFKVVWRVEIDPRNIFIDKSLPPEQNLLEIERNGDPDDKVDLLLIGDGYTAEELGKFRSDARRMADALFRYDPFRKRRNDFNVWGLCPPSLQSGISRPSTGIHIDTPVGATYDAFGSERYVLTFDNKALRTVASRAPNEFIVILVNSHTYGGGGIYNHFATVAVDNDWADYLFVHEFGHHFAGLADEYYTSPVAYEPPEEVTEPWEANATALLDRDHLKWKDLVKKGTPLPTPWPKDEFEKHAKDIQARRQKIRAENRPESEMSDLFREQRAFETNLLSSAKHSGSVGAFRGANYDAEAFYRPQIDCIMFSRNKVPFCVVCQRALESVINLYTPQQR